MKRNVLTTKWILLSWVLAALILQSCGGGKKEFIIKPQSTQVKGILGDYLQVKDGECKVQKVKEDGSEWSISIPLKRIKKPLNACNHYNLSLDLTLLDSKGQPVNMSGNFEANTAQVSTGPKICGLLQDDNTTDDYIVFSKYSEINGKAIEFPDDIAAFTVGSSGTYSGNGETAPSLERDFSKESSGSSGETSSTESATTGSQDWDKILKDYAEYTDKYIALMKKVKNHDATAMSEYQDMYNQAEKFGNDLEKGQSSLSQTQLSKMMEIQTKLANAAMEMTKQ